MSSLRSTLRAGARASNEVPITFEQWMSYFTLNGLSYPYGIQYTDAGIDRIHVPGTYAGLAEQGYKGNGVVFAVETVRLEHFSQARFQWQRIEQGSPGDTFGTPELGILETPWSGGTTSDLLKLMLLHADFGGNAFVVRMAADGDGPERLSCLRPDWVTVVLGSVHETGPDPVWDPAAVVIGYVYEPGGPGSGEDPIIYFPEDVAHFMWAPDPLYPQIGMSWLIPVIRDLQGDIATCEHKLTYFERGGTPNLVVTLDEPDPKKFDDWVAKFKEKQGQQGVVGAYKTLYFGAGADAKVVGSDLRQLDFKVTQGAGETRIAAAGQVPPVLVGLSEGLQAATYSNYASARRRFADGTIWPLWANVSGSLQRIMRMPSGPVRLWVDIREVPFLREDRKDAATIQARQAQTIRTLVDGGFTPESVVKATVSEDWNLLVHSGLLSVQLWAPGAQNDTPPANGTKPSNGATPASVPGRT